jgi:hypothetical protein
MKGSRVGNSGGRLCTKGKSCGATCIYRGDRCELELGPEIQAALPKVRSIIEKVRPVVDNYDQINNPEKVTTWLDKNKEDMALWGLTKATVDRLIREKPEYITFGIEPYSANEHWEGLTNLGKSVFEANSPYRDTTKKQGKSVAVGPLGDLIFKANTYKLVSDVSQKLGEIDPTTGKMPNSLASTLAAAGLNEKKILEMLQKGGMINSDGTLSTQYKVVPPANRQEAMSGKIDWSKANGLIMAGAGLSTFGSANPSGLWKPSQDYGQFKELYEAAGKDPGPFKNNNTWYKYSSGRQADELLRIVKEAKPKMMYFGGNQSDEAEKRIRSEFQRGGTFRIGSQTQAGKSVEKEFRYHVYQHPDGSRTVAVFGPHTGARGFNSNRNLMLGAGEVAKGLINEGVVPKQISSAKILGTGDLAPIKVAKGAVVAKPAKVADEIKAKGGGSSGMADWSVLKLQKAYERAYNAGDELKMRQIVQVLKNKGALVE